MIREFEPRISLSINEPCLRLELMPRGAAPTWFTPMHLAGPGNVSFCLARPVDELVENLWPPIDIPSPQRVSGMSVHGNFARRHPNLDKIPTSEFLQSSEIHVSSNVAFRIRQSLEPRNSLQDRVNTFATFDEALYTPTEDKPFRGIWVGDYSAHGAEILLLHQPDSEPSATLAESYILQREGEPVEVWESRKKQARIYSGSLTAIKLTGDRNVRLIQFMIAIGTDLRTGPSW